MLFTTNNTIENCSDFYPIVCFVTYSVSICTFYESQESIVRHWSDSVSRNWMTLVYSGVKPIGNWMVRMANNWVESDSLWHSCDSRTHHLVIVLILFVYIESTSQPKHRMVNKLVYIHCHRKRARVLLH